MQVEEDSELNMKKLKEDLLKERNENMRLEEEVFVCTLYLPILFIFFFQKNSLKTRIKEVEDLERSLTNARTKDQDFEDLKASVRIFFDL